MNWRLLFAPALALLLVVCKGSTETTSTTATTSTQTTAAAAPPPAATETVATQTGAPPAAPAPAGTVLATQETNWPGVVAEVTEFRRKGNTLTAKVRFTNKGTQKPQVEVIYKDVYLLDTAGGKKYEVLKDEKGAYIAANHQGWEDRWYESLEPGTALTTWIKFPAPPPDVKAITLQLPKTPPFEDIAIQE